MSLFWSPKLLRFGKEHERLRQSPISLVPGTVCCLLAIAVSQVWVHSASAQTAAAWGSNSAGQLGDGTTTNKTSPVNVLTSGILSGKKIVQITAGLQQSLALCSDGTVASWGSNGSGELGDGTTVSKSSPIDITNSGVLNGKRVVQLAAGGDTESLAVAYSLALCSDGTVAAWGNNNQGQLGDGTTVSKSRPVNISNSGALNGKRVVQLAAGGGHSLALCSDGTVIVWGFNGYGQLGNGTTTNSTTPINITNNGALSGKRVVQLAGGVISSLAVCSDGALVTWGYNGDGQLGDGTNANKSTPVNISSVAGSAINGKQVVQIGVGSGSSYSFALCSDGTVAAWGYNGRGQLGDGTTGFRSTPVNITNSGVLSGKRVVQLSGGSDEGYGVALCSDGTVAAWGYNNQGQLGTGNTARQTRPVAVSTTTALSGKKVTQIAGGNQYTLAIVDVAQTVATTGTAPSVIISEFRSGTSANPLDEYIELYNASGSPLDLQGYRVVAGSSNPGQTLFTFTASTVVPVRGHVLLANPGYTLSAVASSDSTLSGDIPTNGGVALLNPSGQIVDQAGVAGYLEGSALPAPPASGKYAYVRRVLPTSANGAPADSNDNASDFMLVSTSSTSQVAAPRLGAPGPENLASPLQTNGIISQSLVCQHRIGTGNSGSLTVRRRLTNTSTSLYITGLRLRLNDVSAGTGKTADVRPVGGDGTTAPGRTLSNGTVAPAVPTNGRFTSLLLGAPSTGTGGANSVLVPPSTFFSTFSLAPGASIDVEYTLNVVTSATYALSINFETTTSSSPPQPA